MSEEMGKEVLERTGFDDSIENHVTTAKDMLGKTSVVTEEAAEITDTPTELTPAVKKTASIGFFILVVIAVWYFFLRRK